MGDINRKLASIRKISSVEPIEGADNIELVYIDGWQCVTKKGEFKADDLCVYFEIDSFLPIRPEFEFLRKSSCRKMGNKEGFRLKTIRLRGQLSQGLALPINSLFPGADENFLLNMCQGLDITEMIGVEKYDPPIPAQLAGICKGNFPSFIRKTDQERVQNIWDKIKDSKESFEVTIKLDGTSCTYYLKDGVFGVCSRNLELIETEDNTLWRLAREMKVEDILRKYGKNIALQGEVIGEGIQGNPESLKGQQFFLFDIWDIDQKKYYNPSERMKIITDWVIIKNYKILHVPTLINNKCLGPAYSLSDFKSINDIISFADGTSLSKELYVKSEILHFLDNSESIREGLVFKSNDSDLTFKVISNEYLLKEKS